MCLYSASHKERWTINLNYKKSFWTRKVHEVTFFFFSYGKRTLFFIYYWLAEFFFNAGIHLSLKNKKCFLLSLLLLVLSVIPPGSFLQFFWRKNVFICNEFWRIFLEKKSLYNGNSTTHLEICSTTHKGKTVWIV